MKKLCALLLTLVLILALAMPALADLPYIRALPQYTFALDKVLTPESYPEVCITTRYPYSLFTARTEEAPIFLCFPAPDGAQAMEFDSDSAQYMDDEKLIDYSVYDSASYEELINRAEKDEYVLLDGSDGTAAYIDPERIYAYGMIGAKEFGKSAKLLITIRLYNLNSRMPLETRENALKAAVLAEVERVRAAMRYETKAPFWSYGQFAGIKLLDGEDKHLCCIDFPAASVTMKDGSTVQAPFIITEVNYCGYRGYYYLGSNGLVEVRAEFRDHAYAVSNYENQREGASKITLSNGSEWYFYASNTRDDGTIYSWYAAKMMDVQSKYGKPYYVSINYSGTNILWADIEDCKQDILLFENGLKVIPVEDDPYVAAPVPVESEPETVTPAPASAPAPVAAPVAETWTCSQCGAENSGNFCPNCGAAKPTPTPAPVSNEWACPTCAQVNTGNFCSNCGTAKPVSNNWFCPNCGQENTGKFCPNCGTAKP